MVETLRRRIGGGLVAVVLSSLFFASSGTFAKALLATGWSPLAVVTIRVAGAALILLPWTLAALRGRWREVRRSLGLVAAYGLFAIGAAQLGYFSAVRHLDVAVALLIEYLAIVLVVLWVWVRTRQTPHGFTLLGVVLAIGGLALVVDIFGAAPPNVVGVLWALFAASGMAGHYIIAARPSPVPVVAFAGLGLVCGSVLLLLPGLLGIVPLEAGHGPVTLAGVEIPAWLAFVELCLVAAAAAYLLGIVGARRLGSTLSSFVGLSEVLFALLIAWLLLGEAPGWVQLVGGALILAGVVAVRLGELRHVATEHAQSSPEQEAPGVPPRTHRHGRVPVSSSVPEGPPRC